MNSGSETGRGSGIRTHDLFVPKDQKSGDASACNSLDEVQKALENYEKIKANLAEKILMILQLAESPCYANATQLERERWKLDR